MVVVHYILCSISKVTFKPVEEYASNTIIFRSFFQKDMMIYRIKGFAEIEKSCYGFLLVFKRIYNIIMEFGYCMYARVFLSLMKVYSLLKTTFSNILDIEDNSDMGL